MNKSEDVLTHLAHAKAVEPKDVMMFYVAAKMVHGRNDKAKHEVREEAQHFLMMLAAMWPLVKGKQVLKVYEAAMNAQTAAYKISRQFVVGSLEGAFADAMKQVGFAHAQALFDHYNK